MEGCIRGAGRAQSVVTFAQWLPLLSANPLMALGTRSFRTAVLPGAEDRYRRERETD